MWHRPKSYFNINSKRKFQIINIQVIIQQYEFYYLKSAFLQTNSFKVKFLDHCLFRFLTKNKMKS